MSLKRKDLFKKSISELESKQRRMEWTNAIRSRRRDKKLMGKRMKVVNTGLESTFVAIDEIKAALNKLAQFPSVTDITSACAAIKLIRKSIPNEQSGDRVIEVMFHKYSDTGFII